MKCLTCHADTVVLETRDWRDGLNRRTRGCFNGHRFYTYEVPAGYLNTTLRRGLRAETVQGRKRAERMRQFMQANPEVPRAAVAKKFGVSSGRARALWRELKVDYPSETKG